MPVVHYAGGVTPTSRSFKVLKALKTSAGSAGTLNVTSSICLMQTLAAGVNAAPDVGRHVRNFKLYLLEK